MKTNVVAESVSGDYYDYLVQRQEAEANYQVIKKTEFWQDHEELIAIKNATSKLRDKLKKARKRGLKNVTEKYENTKTKQIKQIIF